MTTTITVKFPNGETRQARAETSMQENPVIASLAGGHTNYEVWIEDEAGNVLDHYNTADDNYQSDYDESEPEESDEPYEPEDNDDPFYGDDAAADADVLRNAGWGTDEDYGYYGDEY